MRSFALILAWLLASSAAVAQHSSVPKAGQRTATTAAQQEERPELTAVGGLGASNMYTSFLALDAIHDTMICGAYDAEKVLPSVQLIAGFLKIGMEHLQAVQQSHVVSAEDAAFLADMVDAYKALHRESYSLVDYVQTGNEADDKIFQQERENAWGKISRLLKLE